MQSKSTETPPQAAVPSTDKSQDLRQSSSVPEEWMQQAMEIQKRLTTDPAFLAQFERVRKPQ